VLIISCACTWIVYRVLSSVLCISLDEKVSKITSQMFSPVSSERGSSRTWNVKD